MIWIVFVIFDKIVIFMIVFIVFKIVGRDVCLFLV